MDFTGLYNVQFILSTNIRALNSGVKSLKLCYKEEQNLTTSCWIGFFDFNLCFPLLLFTKRMMSIHHLPASGNPASLWEVKPKSLCSGKYPDPVHL